MSAHQHSDLNNVEQKYDRFFVEAVLVRGLIKEYLIVLEILNKHNDQLREILNAEQEEAQRNANYKHASTSADSEVFSLLKTPYSSLRSR